jgi:tetratricopeptide (TPR) repeat protein
VAVPLAGGLFDAAAGPRFGYRVDRSDLERALPVTVERPGLVVHLPAGLKPELRSAIADDHAFRLHQIEQVLDFAADEVIHSWVYRNAEEKARLMGGRGTQVAKTWLREIHIHHPVSPHPVLAHELVHVVAAGFGSWPLGVSARAGVAVNLGLVEGLAEAITAERGELDLDRQSRALRILGRAPDMRHILGPSGFWGQAPRRAYAVAGSFVRHLLANHGAEPLRAAYATGDFETAYQRSLDELVSDWERTIDAIELTESELRLAGARSRRPSIFKRTCAHEVAQLRRDARRAPADRAVPIYRAICVHLADSPACQLDLALAQARAGDEAGLLDRATTLLAGDRLDEGQQARLLEVRGNVLWRRGHLDSARADFSRVLDLDLDRHSRRLQWVRLWALAQEEPLRDELRRFLRGDLSPKATVVRLSAAAQTGDRTIPYLIARQLVRVGDNIGALPWLQRSANHPFTAIELERQRLIAHVYWELARLDEAEAAYRLYVESVPWSGERARARDWLARIAWHRARVE